MVQSEDHLHRGKSVLGTIITDSGTKLKTIKIVTLYKLNEIKRKETESHFTSKRGVLHVPLT